MYSIKRVDGHLRVSFKADLNYGTIKRLIYEELMIPDFTNLHEIWLVGNHRAQLQLGDLQTIVDDFDRLFPRGGSAKKTAIVAEPGLTSAILELLATGLDRKLPLSCRLFNALPEAEQWIGLAETNVA